ncbi:MAG: hypothetical protein H7338_14920 [Candidatus Sericytochromatia bacterium]|nr:hypothetical protein [Candidatus Sericytochromatia bacterium]
MSKRVSMRGGLDAMFEPTVAEAPAGHAVVEPVEIHDQRATFYFSGDQLMALEVLMLKLRTEYRLKIGKSEIVRAAFDALMADFEAKGADSIIVGRYRP